MVKIDNLNNQPNNNQTEKERIHSDLSQTNTQVAPNPTNKGLFTLPDSVMKLVP